MDGQGALSGHTAAGRIGELWEFPLGAPGCLGWVVVGHEAGGRALVVPADNEAVLGPDDRAMPLLAPTAAGRRAEMVALRPGGARWIAAADLWFRTPLTIAPAYHAELASLAEAARAERPDAQHENHHDPFGFEPPAHLAAPELDRWLGRVSARATLERAGEGPATGLARPLAAAGPDPLDGLASRVGEGPARWRLGGDSGLDWLVERTDDGAFTVEGAERPARLFRLTERGGRSFVATSPRITGGWRGERLEPRAHERFIVDPGLDKGADPDARVVDVSWSWPD